MTTTSSSTFTDAAPAVAPAAAKTAATTAVPQDVSVTVHAADGLAIEFPTRASLRTGAPPSRRATNRDPDAPALFPLQRAGATTSPTVRLTTAVDAVLPSRWSDRRQWARIERAVAGAKGRVQAGPFAGLILAEVGVRSRIPKLLGSYEAELQRAVRHTLSRRPELVLHVGAGDGYYAAGIARALPKARVIAYDADPAALAVCATTVQVNGVGHHVALRERCHPESFLRMLSVPTLMILDAEAALLDVLTETALAQLVTTDLVVELSESSSWLVTEILHRGLSRTHEFVRVDALPRDPSQYPLLAGLPESDRLVALEEERFLPHRWLVALSTSRF